MRRILLLLVAVAALMASTLLLNKVFGWFDPVATVAAVAEAAARPETRWIAVLAVVAILAADALWAVPNLTVVVVAGAVLGPGTAALAGTGGFLLASLIGFLVGRVGGPALVRRWCTPDEADRLHRLAGREALAMLVLLRPLPLAADIAAVAAGLARVGPGRFLAAALLGAAPVATAAAVAGSLSSASQPWLGLGAILGLPALAAVLWWFRRTPLVPGTAVITGGSGGIGAAIARELAGRGWRVVVQGRDPARLAALAAEGMVPVAGDCATAAGCAAVAAAVRTAAPRIDLLVHAAGTQVRWAPDEVPPDGLDEEIALQIQAPIRLTGALAPHLSAGARIVAVTSCLGIVPKRIAPGYSAAKAGLRQWIRAQRLRGPWPVVELLPPLVDTPMTAGRGRRKLPPAAVATALVRGLERRRRCIPVGPAGVLLVLAAVWPALATRLVQEPEPGVPPCVP